MRLSDDNAVVIVEPVANTIATSTATWGTIRVRLDEGNSILGVVGVSERDGPRIDVSRDILRSHVLGNITAETDGLWYRSPEGLHTWHRWLLRINATVPTPDFATLFETWRLTGQGAAVIITYDRDGPPSWAAWAVTPTEVHPLVSTVLRADTADPIEGLAPDWPIADLKAAHIAVVGVGSIGSATAHALAMSGVGRISLIDDDRLLWHNLVRHLSPRAHVGRFKVDSVADVIRPRWPGTTVDPLRLNVITHADEVRPLVDVCDVVVCAADGVSPRRVVSHLARRSRKTAVLACVLLDGAVGEVLRLRPWNTQGCLLCQRRKLVDDGVFDPEPLLDRPYGEGERHLPMTAVGSDLQLVGQLAAKVAVATVLEGLGHYDQSIRQEYAVLGLRPGTNTAELPAPFDPLAGELRWLPATPPFPDCPTCAPCLPLS